jgi:1-deoxy-D-xylulose-5-phosphate reductoisomerase
MKKQICLLGSTGSIGTQALDVISQHADLYEVYCLTANNRVNELAAQARKFHPAAVVIANEAHYEELKQLLTDEPDIKVYAGAKALDEIVEAAPIDMVLGAMVGFAGLSPTLHAIKAHKKICLANKETLVVAGELVCQMAAQYHAPILPVDSEHSAIFQSLVGEDDNEIEKILLTCSGGPFRTLSKEEITRVTAADALKHPTWDMGAKITIDSATLMNKGFEVMEAKWLFGVPAEKIQVLIHPQSIVHSAVQFVDGGIKAQLGVPDMRSAHPVRFLVSQAVAAQRRPPRPVQAVAGVRGARHGEVPLPRAGVRSHPAGRQHAVHPECGQRDCQCSFPSGRMFVLRPGRHH